ncbi:MAG: site-specific DNA-methyltransferase [Candidatus Electronema sp. V4]|uniref:site-specific DNA-methyltransferase n=1 Tax=Candidatus Electronema sp. V4 TaxID=3454756 RepID=UPI004055444D
MLEKMPLLLYPERSFAVPPDCISQKTQPQFSADTMKSTTKKRNIEQYKHLDKERLNIPEIGHASSATDQEAEKKQYAHDPHIDPQLQWAGKAVGTSFDVPTVRLHKHERVDPKRIIDEVRKEDTGPRQPSLFEFNKKPLWEAVEFYQHPECWTNRLVAGDSLLVMNSLLEKEGMAGKVQMVYFDPPYGIKYGSNFQPFVSQRNVTDGKDADLTAEPETIKAFRDTWEMGIHSYLTHLRDRLLLAKELLHESGSIFVQIGDENVHRVRCLLDEVFGHENFVSQISFRTTAGFSQKNGLSRSGDYILWYAKCINLLKLRKMIRFFEERTGYGMMQLADSSFRGLSKAEKEGLASPPEAARIFNPSDIGSQGAAKESQPFQYNGKTFFPSPNSHWKANYPKGMQTLARAGRIYSTANRLSFIRFADDYGWAPFTNNWDDTVIGGFTDEKIYTVQTITKVIQRCILMSTDPGDLVLDITCGSGTTAYVAEQWGRRWITCDTSRVAVTIARRRLTKALFDYYRLADPKKGVSGGFKYKTVPHITLKSIANNAQIDVIWDKFQEKLEPLREQLNQKMGTIWQEWEIPRQAGEQWPPDAVQLHSEWWGLRIARQKEIDASIAANADSETLYDQPYEDKSKVRVSGPFTVEAVPSLHAKSLEQIEQENNGSGESVTRSGETLRQAVWRDELLKTGIRAKGGRKIEFSRVEALSGTRWIQCEAETKEDCPQKVLIVFGPEHAPLDPRMVENAWQEAKNFRPDMLLFCAFHFDENAALEIDNFKPDRAGMQLLKVQMNADLFTDDLKKKRASNESFWLIGQPDVAVKQIAEGEDKGRYQVEVLGFDYYNPQNGKVESGGKNNIVTWELDTDYDYRSVFPNQVFFPMAGDEDGWGKLAKNLKAEIDQEKIEYFRGTVSLPFAKGQHSRIAVKIIDDRGIESLRVINL